MFEIDLAPYVRAAIQEFNSEYGAAFDAMRKVSNYYHGLDFGPYLP